LFEIYNAFRRPGVYLYWLAIFVFTLGSFATGSLPLQEKEHVNAPFLIGLWCAGMTMFMMAVSSSIMGMPLYRDIEYNTKDYYLTYPISKAGYFFGRFCGAFCLMVAIATAIPCGIWLASKLGPAMHWIDAARYGPNRFFWYLHPFVTIALPNLFFTACFFFGLVSATRNIKVIYSGGILLFLGYLLAQFMMSHTNNVRAIMLADPFALNPIRYLSMNTTGSQKNLSVIPIGGAFLLNRIGWTTLGLVILFYTYTRFNFTLFFSGGKEKAGQHDTELQLRRTGIVPITSRFDDNYNRQSLYTLIKVELNNIIKDNYFWIIIASGLFFLGFIFWLGDNYYGAPSYPRTVMMLENYNGVFMFFIFFILLFYTGETLHRDRVTRYAYINDSLPTPNRVLSGSKLISLLVLATGLACTPLIIGLPIQLLRGFYQINFLLYLQVIFAVILPRLFEMVILAYFIHVIINNKFAAHAAAIAIWTGLFFLHSTTVFNYNLFLYSYTPDFSVSDMDGMGHMLLPVSWFNLYWILAAGLLALIAALFFPRGFSFSFKERRQLIPERFDKKTRITAALLALCFLATAAWNYYNTSYLNQFFSKAENKERAAIYEKKLKKYDALPLPKVTGLKIYADLFPDQREEKVKAFVTIANKTHQPVKELLLDGDELTEYAVLCNGNPLQYTSPLLYRRGKMDFFHSGPDTAAFRLYQLANPLAPGDTAVLEVRSSVVYKGFSNGLSGPALLRNGIYFNGGLPGLGYDDDDELHNTADRKEFGLPAWKDTEIEPDDSTGISRLKSGATIDLLNYDLTVSTAANQRVIASGILEKQWKENGRNYFHYKQPGLYGPLVIMSARYNEYSDSVSVNDKSIQVNVYYQPEHGYNKQRFAEAFKDGIRYFSNAYGSYPFSAFRFAEASIYTPRQTSFPGLTTTAEYFLWTTDFSKMGAFDHSYFESTRELAQQWWRYQVAPNNTNGSLVISEGLATYSALALFENKFGGSRLKTILENQAQTYAIIRNRDENEHPLIRANFWHEWNIKAGIVLYGLKDLIGEDNINAALREFRNAYAFKNTPPYAGANDLYRCLQKHTPDSLQYYLNDTWNSVTLYDNKIMEAKAVPGKKTNEWLVTIKCSVGKTHRDGKGNDTADNSMQDYIDIGIFGAANKDSNGQIQDNPLYFQKHKLSAGQHTVSVTVTGKPLQAGIDPWHKLIDHVPHDNMKDIAH